MALQSTKDKCGEDEFGRPVESIMRCEDFKSSFARRLSNRYSKPPVCPPKQEDLQKKLTPDLLLAPDKVQIDAGVINKDVGPQLNEDAVKSLEQVPAASAFIKGTEVTVLNIEIETLRWQLAQTEANRQMHLALLKQIVSFLARIRDHMQLKKSDFSKSLSPRVMQKRGEMPRSHSVLHVNNNIDFPLLPSRKLNPKRSFVSASNVNRFTDTAWKQSKLSLTPEINPERKMTEEISRLITLANTVLSTKLPELAGANITNDDTLQNKKVYNTDRGEIQVIINEPKEKLNLIEEDDASNVYTLNTRGNSDMTNKYIEPKDDNSKCFLSVPSSLTSGFEDDFASVKLADVDAIENKDTDDGKHTRNIKPIAERRCENCVGNLVEDESGFSSMSSFQEIGIPIINIIPPNDEPTTYNGELDSISTSNRRSWDLEEDEDELKPENGPVKVFWV